MTISFSFFDYNFSFIIVTILWIIQSGSLVVGSHLLKGEEDTPGFLNSLFLAGIISILWYITSFFIPTEIDATSESKDLLFSVVLILYFIIPNSIFIILGVAFLIFFYRNSHIHEKMLIYTPILIIVGGVLRLILYSLIQYYLFYDIEAFIDFNDYAITLDIILLFLQLPAIIVIFLYSIYLNNKYFMIFSSLFLVQLLATLIPMFPWI